MSQYDKLDQLILSAIGMQRSALYSPSVNAEAGRIAQETGREAFRVIDCRLQALRRAKQIRHMTKAESNGQGGWRVIKGGE